MVHWTIHDLLAKLDRYQERNWHQARQQQQLMDIEWYGCNSCYYMEDTNLILHITVQHQAPVVLG